MHPLIVAATAMNPYAVTIPLPGQPLFHILVNQRHHGFFKLLHFVHVAVAHRECARKVFSAETLILGVHIRQHLVARWPTWDLVDSSAQQVAPM